MLRVTVSNAVQVCRCCQTFLNGSRFPIFCSAPNVLTMRTHAKSATIETKWFHQNQDVICTIDDQCKRPVSKQKSEQFPASGCAGNCEVGAGLEGQPACLTNLNASIWRLAGGMVDSREGGDRMNHGLHGWTRMKRPVFAQHRYSTGNSQLAVTPTALNSKAQRRAAHTGLKWATNLNPNGVPQIITKIPIK